VIVDISKGIFPVLIGFGFGLPVWAVSMSGVAAVAGQMWPLLGGHGEKGNSTGVGALMALALVYESYLVLASLGFFAIGGLAVLVTSRTPMAERSKGKHPLHPVFPAAMLLGFTAAPALSAFARAPWGITAALGTTVFIIAVRRLTAGLRTDMSVGAPMGPVLLRRLLFDQPLTGRDWS